MVKKAHFITGKGGVGKSLFSVVLAHYFGKNNSKVLLSDLTEPSFLKNYLSLPDISYKATSYNGLFDICQLNPEACLREYSLHLLKIESLYKLFFENPVSKSLIEVAPGLQELAVLGKITSSPRRHGPAMNYDEIVIDAPSTGHFLSLLRAPKAMAEAISFGPMSEQSKSIDRYIRNVDFTKIHLVSLAEELPITETIDLYEQLKSEFGLTAKVYLNKVLSLSDSDFLNLPENIKLDFKNKTEQELKAKTRLTENKIDFIELPFVANFNTTELINELVLAMQEKNV